MRQTTRAFCEFPVLIAGYYYQGDLSFRQEYRNNIIVIRENCCLELLAELTDALAKSDYGGSILVDYALLRSIILDDFNEFGYQGFANTFYEQKWKDIKSENTKLFSRIKNSFQLCEDKNVRPRYRVMCTDDYDDHKVYGPDEKVNFTYSILEKKWSVVDKFVISI